MRALVGKEYQFRAEDSGTLKDVVARDKLLANCMAPPLLTLKKGAQVMLIKNIDDTLVNGSLGQVVSFMNERTFEYYMADPSRYQELPEEGATINITRSKEKLK